MVASPTHWGLRFTLHALPLTCTLAGRQPSSGVWVALPLVAAVAKVAVEAAGATTASAAQRLALRGPAVLLVVVSLLRKVAECGPSTVCCTAAVVGLSAAARLSPRSAPVGG